MLAWAGGKVVRMAFIPYLPGDQIPEDARVPDKDHIIRIHAVHPAVMKLHYDLYRELMHAPGSLTRRQRELIAVRVSAINGCHY
jgi:alkylhydroperoxidase family enzyme